METQKYVLPPPKIVTIDGTTPPGINQPIIKNENMLDIQVPIVQIPTTSPALQLVTGTLQLNGTALLPTAPLTTLITPSTAPIVIKRENRKSESEKDDKDKRPRSR